MTLMARLSLKETYSSETFNLLNPAFCGLILMSTAQAYYRASGLGMPLSLSYLALPLVLHEESRRLIGKQRYFAVWVATNQELLVGFSERASALVPFVSSALDFLLREKNIRITKGRLVILQPIKTSAEPKLSSDDEIVDCVKHADLLGKLFSKANGDVDIYSALGVKP